ncbi:MAG: hypothetical protein U0324_11640 [Polyangiales bacterium]
MGHEFVSAMRRLWVTHDPLRFVGDGAETLDVYDHQAYVTALCADEIGSAADAEKVIATILRHEFGIRSPIWSDPEFAPRLQRLAEDVAAVVARRPARAITQPYAAR